MTTVGKTDEIPQPRIKVLMIDDHQWVIDGFKPGLAEHGIDLLCAGNSPDKIKALYVESHPDVLVVDYRFGKNRSVLPDLKVFFEDHPRAKVLVLSQFSDVVAANEFLDTGVLGYMTKDCTAEDLAEGIISVYEGRVFLGPSISQLVAESKYKPPGDPFRSLSRLEFNVAMGLAEGKTVDEIAVEAGVSKRWAMRTITEVRQVIGIHRGSDILKEAIRFGYIKI